MNALAWAPIIINMGTLLVAGVGVIGARRKIMELHMTLNSRLDQLMELSRLKGMEQGRVAEVERVKDA